MLLTVAEAREHVATDLSDAALQRVLDAAEDEIMLRHGPHADPDSPLTVVIAGGLYRLIHLARPLDAVHPATVTETHDGRFSFVGGEEVTELTVDDWRVWHGGRSLERLRTGPNPRAWWGDRVTVTYVPMSDTAQRVRVVVELVKLDLAASGYTSFQVGEIRFGLAENYPQERERVLASLGPRMVFA